MGFILEPTGKGYQIYIYVQEISGYTNSAKTLSAPSAVGMATTSPLNFELTDEVSRSDFDPRAEWASITDAGYSDEGLGGNGVPSVFPDDDELKAESGSFGNFWRRAPTPGVGG